MKKKIDTLNILSPRTFAGANSIAIVGNAGISEQDNERIESADKVIRFNNYATRAGIEYTADRYRCDILFSTFDLHSAGSSPPDVVIGIPFPFKVKNIIDKAQKWYSRSRLWMINPYLNSLLCEELELNSEGYRHPLPSVGFTCLWHLHRIMQHNKAVSPGVFVAGFKWYSDPEKLTIQDRKVSLPRPSHFNHHYREEMKWIIDNLFEHPNFIFSDDCNHILNTFKPHL